MLLLVIIKLFYGNSDNVLVMYRKFMLWISTLLMIFLPPSYVNAHQGVELTLTNPVFLGDASMNILFEIENSSGKKMEVLTIYSNNFFPAQEPTAVVGHTYPFVGSIDPSYSDNFKYNVLVRGYLLNEFKFVQGYVKIEKNRFRKTGFITYRYFLSNVVDMHASIPGR